MRTVQIKQVISGLKFMNQDAYIYIIHDVCICVFINFIVRLYSICILHMMCLDLYMCGSSKNT